MGVGGQTTRRVVLGGLGAAAITGLGSRRSACAQGADSENLAQEFQRRGVTGTFVHLDTATDRTLYVDEKRAARRFAPASTFDIANALIALETGVISSLQEVIHGPDASRGATGRAHDLSVDAALGGSAVSVFQEIARRVGIARYEDWLEKLGYGNAAVGRDVETFWLDGPLAISAYEQAGLMAALAREEVENVSIGAQRAVKDALRVETQGQRALYAKTGWCRSSVPQIGWWVGWVEHGARVDSFALNIDVNRETDFPLITEIGRAILVRLALY